MEKLLRNFRDDRISMTLQNLSNINAEFAVAKEKELFFHEMLVPIFNATGCITLCGADLETLRDYIDQLSAVQGIALEAVYQQGYLDCVQLLRTFGVLT